MTCEIAPDVRDSAVGDPGRLKQVLLNLVSNAVKFTESGKVAVRAETLSKAPESVLLKFAVRDTGIGIPIEKQRSIFDAFTQVDTSVTRRFGGTGLGLTISSQLVSMMGGKIWVESEPGKGSTFHFSASFGAAEDLAQNGVRRETVPGSSGGARRTLCATEEPARATDSGAAGPTELLPRAGPVRATHENPVDFARAQATTVLANQPAPTRDRAASRLRVLVVDDNVVNREVAARLLARRGHVVESVSSGRGAVEELAKHSYDLVMMDVQMPDMDGFEATADIRRRELTNGTHVPIIAMTAYAMEGDRKRCLAAGMDGYVAKPISLKTLPAEIEEVLSATELGSRV